MTDYAELRAALEQTCHALLIDDPDTIRALLAERDALREALCIAEDMLCKQENELRTLGCYEPCPESAIITARAALAQGQGGSDDA